MNVSTPLPNPLRWSTDPVVLFEKAVMPASAGIYRMLCTDADGARSAFGSDTIEIAVSMLRSGALALLKTQNISPSSADIALLKDAAHALETFDVAHRSNAGRAALLDLADTRVTPALNDALDAYRRVFISHVLHRQGQHAKQSRAAISELRTISKQIFFISINAGIEAARVGETGRAFKQISGDIRALSESAQDAIGQLSTIVDAD